MPQALRIKKSLVEISAIYREHRCLVPKRAIYSYFFTPQAITGGHTGKKKKTRKI
jgi:hypothetical protein